MAGTVDQLLVQIDATTQSLRRELQRAERSIGDFERKADRNVAAVERRFDRMGTGIATSVRGIGASLGALAVGRGLLTTITEFERLDQRIKTLTGTTEAYDEAQNYLRETSNRLATDLAATTDSYAKLLTLQNSGLITQDQSRALLEGFADAAAATGTSTQSLGQIMYGLSQALASGVVRAEEFNQVTEPMPGLLQAMERAAGLSAGGLRELVNDGEVTSRMFGETLVKALQEFAGEAEKRADTIGGKWQVLNNKWVDLQRSLSQPVADVLAPTLETATNLLSRMDPLIQSLIRINNLAASVSQLPFRALGAAGVATGLLEVDPEARRADLQNERANLLDTIAAREAAGGKFSADIVADARRRINVIDAELEALKGAVYGPNLPMQGPNLPPAATPTATTPSGKGKKRTGGTRGKTDAEKAAEEAARAAEREANAIAGVTDALAFEEQQIMRTVREQEIYSQLRAAGIDANHAAAQSIIEVAGRVYDLEKASQDLTDLMESGDQDAIFGLGAKKIDAVGDSLDQLGTAALGGLQHALVSVGGDFKNLEQVAVSAISHIITELIRMQQTAEAAGKTGPLSGILKAAGGFISGLFGGGGSAGLSFGAGDTTGVGGAGFSYTSYGGPRASGGPVDPSMSYLVGERGPERFVPDVPGVIVPNFAIKPQGSGGGGVEMLHISVASSEEFNVRVENTSRRVSTQVVRQHAPRIVEESVGAVYAANSENRLR